MPARTMHQERARLAARMALSAGIALYGCTSGAQEFPSRQITIVVPVPAGGGSDTFARLIAQKLSTAFGRVVLVDNRAGAGSTIGTEYAARAQPDGHTLLYVSAAVMLMNTFYPKLSIDTRQIGRAHV